LKKYKKNKKIVLGTKHSDKLYFWLGLILSGNMQLPITRALTVDFVLLTGLPGLLLFITSKNWYKLNNT